MLPPHALDASPGVWRQAWRRLRRDRVGMAALYVVCFFVLLVAAARFGWIAADWQREQGVSFANPSFLPNLENREAAQSLQSLRAPAQIDARIAEEFRAVDPLAPSAAQVEQRARSYQTQEPPKSMTLPFGGDKWGRSVLAKMIKGAEVSIAVGLLSALIATFLGTVFGALAGYLGKWVNDFFEWFYNVFTSIPYILLIFAIVAVVKANPALQSKGLLTIVLVLGLTGWTGVYRLVRAEYLKHAQREYVRAADAIGASIWRRMFVHILPNISHIVLVQLSLLVVGFIKAEVILSFLGFGVPVDMVSWGTMLEEAQNELVIGKWWQLVGAGLLTMAVFVTAFSVFTDALRDALDPKLK
jgi:oligopeptide transport system permease protein